MKWLSDHNVNIEVRPFGCNMLFYAEMMITGKKYSFMDIIDIGKLQQYLRSVVFNFKRIYELNS